MTRQLSMIFAILVYTGFSVAAQGQDYPNRPIRLIVPFSPGGTSDIVGRLIGGKLSEELGQTLVVDNRGGAGSTLGTSLAAMATPDGYTLLVSHIGLAINQTLYSKLPYNGLTDLTPVAKVGIAPAAVVTNNKLPVKNMRDLIAMAKQQPGKLNYGSGGVGSSGHLSVALLEYVANVKFTHVPYKGGGPSVLATISGEVQLAIPTLPTAATHAKAGRLRMLAVTSAKRSIAVPDVPTVKESGVPEYVYETWYGIFAPAGVSKSIITRLNQATVKVLGTNDLRTQLSSQGIEPDSSTSAEMAKILRDDTARWSKIIKSAGIPIN